MQFSWCRCPMQGWKCKVYPWWCLCTYLNHDANVSLQRWRCKNLMVQMSSCGYAMMWMPPCGYVMLQMFPCRYAMMRMSHWEYAMMRIFWCKHNLFKNSLYFQNEAFSAPETKIFSKLDLLFMKSHLPFDLRVPKNWWSLLENLWMGHWLEIWWSGSKDLFSQFG